MEENTNTNIEQQTSAQDQEQTKAPDQGEKLFTQEEVNEIVRKRLAKEKAKAQPETQPAAAPAIDDAALTARSNRLDCKEYLLNNGLSLDLLDVIDTSDVSAFIEKCGKVKDAVKQTAYYPNVRDAGEVELPASDDLRDVFFSKAGHTPKKKRK